MIVAWLYSLSLPKRHRQDFIELYKQFRGTDRPEGGLWWAATVFGEYIYPGWTYSEAEVFWEN